MIFEPLVEVIETAIPTLKAGKTLFVNQMPHTAHTGVLLKDSYAGTKIDEDIPELRRGIFVAAARAKNPQEAKTLIEEVVGCLTMTRVELAGMEVKHIRPMTEPIPYQQSAGNYFEYSVSFSAVYGIFRE